MGGAGIEARDLVRTFGENQAVAGLDLSVAPGEIYGFLGPNGAGKSTTVRMLCTLLLPTSGTAEVGGLDVVADADAVRLKIGVALQDAGLDDKQTGREILDIQARLYGLRGQDLERRIAETCRLIDIGDAIDDRVGTYSGGMKRRLDLATALIHMPEVLFLDEPTTGLDPVSRVKVWDEIRTLNQELGMTIFLTTQYMEEADALAERVGIIDGGTLVLEGAPDALKRDVGADLVVAVVPGADDALVDQLSRVDGVLRVDRAADELRLAARDGPALVARVATSLSASGHQPERLTVRTPSLDDVFLQATGHRIEPTVEPEEAA